MAGCMCTVYTAQLIEAATKVEMINVPTSRKKKTGFDRMKKGLIRMKDKSKIEGINRLKEKSSGLMNSKPPLELLKETTSILAVKSSDSSKKTATESTHEENIHLGVKSSNETNILENEIFKEESNIHRKNVSGDLPTLRNVNRSKLKVSTVKLEMGPGKDGQDKRNNPKTCIRSISCRCKTH